jgi:CDP-diacylglycerol--glycerol-3-phosphate 3-phosphatidyltransferase
MNIPTWLTTLRLGLVMIIIGLFFYPYDAMPSLTLLGQSLPLVYGWITLLFIIASITDFLDGYLARKLQQVTVLGTFLDSIADKVLTNATMLALTFPFAWLPPSMMRIPLLLVIIMISRDLLMDALRTLAMSKNVVLSANIYGKIKTFMQMVMIPLVLVNNAPFAWFDSWFSINLTEVIIYLTTLMSLVSFIIYVVQNKKVFSA